MPVGLAPNSSLLRCATVWSHWQERDNAVTGILGLSDTWTCNLPHRQYTSFTSLHLSPQQRLNGIWHEDDTYGAKAEPSFDFSAFMIRHSKEIKQPEVLACANALKKDVGFQKVLLWCVGRFFDREPKVSYLYFY